MKNGLDYWPFTHCKKHSSIIPLIHAGILWECGTSRVSALLELVLIKAVVDSTTKTYGPFEAKSHLNMYQSNDDLHKINL